MKETVEYYRKKDNHILVYSRFDKSTNIIMSVYKGNTDKAKFGINRFTTPDNFKPEGSVILKEHFDNALEMVITKLTEYANKSEI